MQNLSPTYQARFPWKTKRVGLIHPASPRIWNDNETLLPVRCLHFLQGPHAILHKAKWPKHVTSLLFAIGKVKKVTRVPNWKSHLDFVEKNFSGIEKFFPVLDIFPGCLDNLSHLVEKTFRMSKSFFPLLDILSRVSCETLYFIWECFLYK